jgi:hypothetical protein
MSMSEYEDCFVFSCDGCGLEAPFERGGPGTFMTCVSEIKHRGWRIIRDDGDWSHFCSGKECRAAVAKKSAARAKELLDRVPLRSVGGRDA